MCLDKKGKKKHMRCEEEFMRDECMYQFSTANTLILSYMHRRMNGLNTTQSHIIDPLKQKFKIICTGHTINMLIFEAKTTRMTIFTQKP